MHEGGGPEGQDVPRPATVVLDRDGVVRWFSVARNYQVRPDPDDVLRALEALQAATVTRPGAGRAEPRRRPPGGSAS